MTLYVIKTLEKKNVYETQYWSHEDGQKSFNKIEMYRWGEVVIEAEEDLIDEYTLKNEDGFFVSDYEIVDLSLDDGCALYFEECEGVELEEVEEIWEQDYTMGLEDAGYDLEDVDLWLYGPLEITEVNQ
jgi:hypothetical protein